MLPKSTRPGPVLAQVAHKLEKINFESTAEEVLQAGRACIAQSKKLVTEIAEQDLASVSFETSFGILDDLDFQEGSVTSRLYFLQNVHPALEVREAARKIHIEYQEWAVEKRYNEKIYLALKACSSSKSLEISGEDKKLVDDVLRDYRRIGMELPQSERAQVMALQKQLGKLETEFISNINESTDELIVSKEELSGLDDPFIESLRKTEDGKYIVGLEYPEYLPVMEYAENESVRKRLLTKKFNATREKNEALLVEMVKLRDQIAKKLQYPSWNHYVIEDRMAKKPEEVFGFLQNLVDKLSKKAKEELLQLEQLKRELSGNNNAKVEMWDYYYLSSLLKKKNFLVDTQELKNYFSLDAVLAGMFKLFDQIFGIHLEKQAKGSFDSWHDEVDLYLVKDENGAELGYFYMDLHPREGKYNHAAAFSLVEGKLLPSGEYQRPISAMVCNFPRARGDAPALISHSDVETLFHEFGHILHGLLTKAKFAAFSGTSVAWDFVEAPSQVLENWVWDYDSLSTFARHYEDKNKIIPRDLVQKMNAAKKAGSALFYLRQISLAKADLEMHKSGEDKDPVAIANSTMKEIFLEAPEGTSFASSWGHMVGYASGYYGYAWADVMAADLFSIFKNKGVLDGETGRRLRKEIYEPGSSREEKLSLESFLGRPLSSQAFFEELGAA